MLDEFQRIGRVAEALAHLAAELVTHDTCEIDMLERHLTTILVTGHDHAGHPEEDDIRAGDKVGCRIIVFDLGIVGMVDTVEDGDRPQPGREPRVETVALLLQVSGGQSRVLLLRELQSLLGRLSHDKVALAVGSLEIVSRDAVAPPQLTRDTPVLDVLQPVAIGVLVFLGIELNVVVHHRRQGDVSEVLHLQEPLCRELRLDRHIGTLGEAHLVVIVLDLLHQSGIGQIDGNLLAHVHTVLTDIESGSLRDGTVIVEDVDGLQMMLQSEHVVIDVVSRGDFQTAGTKLYVDISVLNHRNDTVDQWHDDVLALEPCVFHVLGVDAHGRVAHDGLGTCSSHDSVVAFLVLMHDVALVLALNRSLVLGSNIVFEIIELRVLVLVDHLLVGQCSLGFRIPVDHAHATIDVALAIEVDKDLDDALGACLVHGESRTVPVAGATELAELLEDDAAVLACPVPGVLKELLTCEVGLLDALLSELADDLCLRSDRSVVSAGHPAGVLSLHARTAHENILNGVVEHVTHVQHTRHIWWGNDDGIGFAIVRLGAEKFVVQPVLIPLRLYFFRVVLTC